jgi:hypothetical protein
MADARQLRPDSERAFRPARAGCRKFFDELNDLGWDLQLQAQKVEREAHENEIKRDEKTIWISVSRGVTERRASRVGLAFDR